MEKTINVDIEVVYFWFDNQNILNNNGDAKIISEIIKEGNYKEFMRFYHYYNEELEWDNNGKSITFFPKEAAIYFQNEYIGDIDITIPTGFNMITESIRKEVE